MNKSSFKLFGISLVAIVLMLLVSQYRNCPDDYYRTSPFINGEGGTDKEMRRIIAERNTIQLLSDMIKHCPDSSRYTVYWSYLGNHVGGHVSGKTVFNREQETFQEWHDAFEKPTQVINNVIPQDVHMVAQYSGDLLRLDKRLRKKTRITNSTR
jgi:hypothetical protein